MAIASKILPFFLLTFCSSLFAGCFGESAQSPEVAEPSRFVVTIENVSEKATVQSAFAPGIWVLHQQGSPLFIEGETDPGLGLENLAEDGSPDKLYDTLNEAYSAGKFDAASDGYSDAAAAPGESFSIEISAKPGDKLSFASMLIQSNDYFIGTSDDGFELFRGNEPITGAIETTIWDAGTEVDEPLGAGDNQPMQQVSPNTGADENGSVENSGLQGGQFVKVTLRLVEAAESD